MSTDVVLVATFCGAVKLFQILEPICEGDLKVYSYSYNFREKLRIKTTGERKPAGVQEFRDLLRLHREPIETAFTISAQKELK